MLLALLACDPAGTTRSAAPGDPPGDAIDDSDPPADTTGPAGDDTATSTTCIPRTCDDACGTLDDGCGSTLDCGGCGPWASCEANQCQTAACVPDEADSTDGGGRCEDLAQAWTARGINVGYYPFRVVADLPQYSGDYDGPAGVTFTRGTTPGVILQIIPAGSFVGLSSTGPYYDPAGECLPSGECGNPDVEACTGSSPPLRPGVAGYYWGYAYGDTVQAYFHTRDGQGVLWDFVEVLSSGAPVLTPASDGAGGDCTASDPSACTPCLNGGTCGWVQDVFLQ